MAGSLIVPSSLDEVLEAFRALLDEREVPAERDADRGNFRCTNCENCDHCRFCNDCSGCEDCTYCDDCTDCSGCTHCNGCERCTQTTHSAWSSACKDSSYVTLCLDCSACVQCFACVGLRNEEFCILNEKLPRKTYFSRVAELRGAFEERIASGWRPPWATRAEDTDAGVGVDEAESEAEPEDHEGEDYDQSEPEDDGYYDEPAAAVVVDDPAPADSSAALRLEALWASEMPQELSAKQEEPAAPPARRTEATVDTGEPADSSDRRSWDFGRDRESSSRFREEDDKIPEPPPFAVDDEPPTTARSQSRVRPEGEETSRHKSGNYDRYGWSAQTEGTPEGRRWDRRDGSRSDPEQWPGASEVAPPPGRDMDTDPGRGVRSRRPWDPDSELKPPLPRWTPEDRERETRPSKPRSDPAGMNRWPPARARDSSPSSEPEPTRWARTQQPPRRPNRDAGWEQRAREAPTRVGRSRSRWEDPGHEEPRASGPRGVHWEDRSPHEPTREPARAREPRWDPRREPEEHREPEPRHVPGRTAEIEPMDSGEIPTRAPRWSPEQRSGRWLPESPLSEPERRRLEESDTSMRRRRRETKANPRIYPLDPNTSTADTEISSMPERGPTYLERELDAWVPYEDVHRPQLGPDDQTEPDAPVARRGPARAEISGAARAGSRPQSGPVEFPDERRSGPRPVKVALGVGRRPERPRPPEPQRGGLIRGRPPARPSPSMGRQSDAPSLRRARRPARVRDDTTSKYRAALASEDSDPGTG